MRLRERLVVGSGGRSVQIMKHRSPEVSFRTPVTEPTDDAITATVDGGVVAAERSEVGGVVDGNVCQKLTWLGG